jgi:acetyl-CoA C-acetyltransferase
MQDAFLIDGARTALGNFRGSLAPLSAVDLGSAVVRELLKRNGLSGQEIDEVVLGCVLQAGLGQNVARQVGLRAGIPKEKTALAVNMVCGSGLRSASLAVQSIRCGDAELVVAGGTESMSNAPYLLPKARAGYGMGHAQLMDSMVHDGLWDIFNDYHMGITAENLAQQYGLSRSLQDEFAARSQQKAEIAIQAGRFTDEIVPVSIPQKKGQVTVFAVDEFPRPGTTMETLAKLRPAFKEDGTVTAGNASGINDGAAAVLVGSGEAATRFGLRPMARVVSYACAGVDPSVMGIGPACAVRRALGSAGWELADVDLIEANEAFAAQSLAVARELGLDMQRVNVNGGAIALGHPIGASGSRILVTLLHEMRKRNARKGLATLCVGGGMGVAMCIELV